MCTKPLRLRLYGFEFALTFSTLSFCSVLYCVSVHAHVHVHVQRRRGKGERGEEEGREGTA